MPPKHHSIGRSTALWLLAAALVALGAAGCTPDATPTLPEATLVAGPRPTVAVQTTAPSPTLLPTALPYPEPAATEPPAPPTAAPTTAPAAPTPSAAAPAGQGLTLTILHTNDVSGWTEPCG